MNGFVFDLQDVSRLVFVLGRALEDEDFVADARRINRQLILDRASRESSRAQLIDFYTKVTKG